MEQPINIPKWKRPLYLTLTTILGLIVSYGLHALIETWYLSYADKHQLVIKWTMHFGLGSCALPEWAQYGLLVLGVVGGFLIGRVWWRMVYVEGRRWRKNK